MGRLDKPLQPDALPGGSCHIALLISFASRVLRWFARVFLLRAWQPQAAKPAAKNDASRCRVPSNPAWGAGNESTCGEESNT